MIGHLRIRAGTSKFGHQGLSFSDDQAIRKDERGHPIKHQLTARNSFESMHELPHAPGKSLRQSLLGYTGGIRKRTAKSCIRNNKKILGPRTRGVLARQPGRARPREDYGATMISWRKLRN